jgi:ribosome-binding protein aMBF1 (putative translation factor)
MDEPPMILKKKIFSKPKNNTKYQKLDDYDTDDIKKIKIADRELSRAIQMARINKNMTQEDLNNECNFPKNTIKDYENCVARVNTQQLNKLNLILGVVLPRN